MKKSKAQLATELGIEEWQINLCQRLLKTNTVNFLAKYRKELTGGLNLQQLRKINEFLEEKQEINEFTLRVLQQHGSLPSELQELIKNADNKEQLRNIIFLIQGQICT